MISVDELRSPTVGTEINPKIKHWALASAVVFLGWLTVAIAQLLG
jgi:hypothetical protein